MGAAPRDRRRARRRPGGLGHPADLPEHGRALAREVGREDVAAAVKVPRHRAGPPETLTDTEYANLLRVPDRRSAHGKRDVALLRVLGDCGLRSAELRGLVARDIRRPRANARHSRLYVRGKGGTCLAAVAAHELVHGLGRQRLGVGGAAVPAEADEQRVLVAQALPARERVHGEPRVERGVRLLGDRDLALDVLALAATWP